MKKKIIILTLIAAFSTSLISCTKINKNTTIVDNTVNSNEEITAGIAIDMLNNAKKISVINNIISLNNSYDIYTDGNKVGTIEGKYINITGDKFVFKSKNGEIIGSEQQIKRWGVKLNRLAEIYNNLNDPIGYIGEEKIKDLFKIGVKFHFYDKDKNEIGYTDKPMFSIIEHFKILDSNNNLLYKIDKRVFSVSDTYDIEVINNKKVPVEQAIYITAIINAINKSKEK